MRTAFAPAFVFGLLLLGRSSPSVASSRSCLLSLFQKTPPVELPVQKMGPFPEEAIVYRTEPDFVPGEPVKVKGFVGSAFTFKDLGESSGLVRVEEHNTLSRNLEKLPDGTVIHLGLPDSAAMDAYVMDHTPHGLQIIRKLARTEEGKTVLSSFGRTVGDLLHKTKSPYTVFQIPGEGSGVRSFIAHLEGTGMIASTEEHDVKFADVVSLSQKVTPPSAADFTKTYPFSTERLNHRQTLVDLDGNEYLLEGYDEKTGKLTFGAYAVRTAAPEDFPGMKASDFVRGKLLSLENSDSRKSLWEVMNYDEHGSGKIFLRRKTVYEIPWKRAESILSGARVTKTVAQDLPRLREDQGFMKTIFPPKNTDTSYIGRRRVKLVGIENVDVIYPNSQPDLPIKSTQYTFSVRTRAGRVEVKASVPISIKLKAETNSAFIRGLLSFLPEHFEDAEAHLRFNEGSFTNVSEIKTLSPGKVVGATANVEGTGASRQRVVDFYKHSLEQKKSDIYRTFFHETGHQIAQLLWDDYLPKQEWIKAIALDGNFVTDYSQTNFKEDFAEIVEEYLATDGGRLDPVMRARHSHRFEFLDGLFKSKLENEPLIARVKKAFSQSLNRSHLHVVVPEMSQPGFLLYRDE